MALIQCIGKHSIKSRERRIMKWKAKIRQRLLIEEWIIKEDGSEYNSNLYHFEFISKNGGTIISKTGYLSHFTDYIKYEEKDIPGIIRCILKVNDIEILSLERIKNNS